MPELPEVETTLRGIQPHLVKRKICRIQVRDGRLRLPVNHQLEMAVGAQVVKLRRRAKYLIFDLKPAGHLLVHLGMSGSLRITNANTAPRKHDHIILQLDNELELRFHDPRRFGIFLYLGSSELQQHLLLKRLGPEPLSPDFSAEHLYQACRNRKAPIKQVIMDAKVVVGVGNIYASEALFAAGVRPGRQARRLTRKQAGLLTAAIRDVLNQSIAQGGTTLRDFVGGTGEPGYFRQQLAVYERAGQPCRHCQSIIRRRVIGQRSTYWCSHCQQ